MKENFPIFFLSFDEANAESHWYKLKAKAPRAVRVHGVQGIFAAHKICASKSNASHFFVVDGDNTVEDQFNFSISEELFHPSAIHVWRCKNAVNDLIYGYGAIKLFPTKPVLETHNTLDLSTGLIAPYKIISELASTTHFNTDPFRSWRSGFREAVKLSFQVLTKGSRESEDRLKIWCSKGEDRPFGKWCINGALTGKAYAERHFHQQEYLKNINDFHWLQKTFVEKSPINEQQPFESQI
jgi:hypothetical protein